jgi:serine/threonine protein kinase
VAGGGVLAGRYELMRLLGRGGMGEVWLAHDMLLDRPVAVKRITSVAPDAAIIKRAMREAQLAGRLSHPNAVAVHDVVVLDGLPNVIMEYVAGTTLADRIADGPRAPSEAAALLAQVAAGLAAAHGIGVVHRDVKPANILIDGHGTAKLADFGIARADSHPGLTQSGMVVGTVAYMAPEVARGSLAVPASDVWSLGATLYCAVEGHPLFDAPNTLAVLAQLITKPAPRASRAGELTDLIARMLQSDPADRPSADEVRYRLAAPPRPSEPRTTQWPKPPGPAEVPEEPAERVPATGRASHGVEDTLRLLDDVARAARDLDRDDLAQPLASAHLAVYTPVCRLVVYGEFKVGKSRLINALLNAAVCVPDSARATTVPSYIRYGEQLVVTSVSGVQSSPDLQPVELPDLAAIVTGRDPVDGQRLEITLPCALLADGLVIIDTPFVGSGLSSAHTAATLRALDSADAILFVSDADQEYSAPELDFIAAAMRICPTAIGVLTKTDVYQHWRRILRIDQDHLRTAGIELPIFPVSSRLRQQAMADRNGALDVESGFPALLARLRADLLETNRRRLAAQAVSVAHTALDQLIATVRTEMAALDRPGDPVLARTLADGEQSAALLQAGGSRWQQTLGARIEQLRSDIDDDLAARLLGARHEAAQRIGDGVPAQVWPSLERWLYRRTNEELIAHFVQLRSRSEQVAADAAAEFRRQAGEVIVSWERSARSNSRAQPWGDPAVGRTGGHPLFGLGPSALLALPATAALGAALGRETWRTARARQFRAARAEMQHAVDAYLDQASLGARTDSRLALQTVHDRLRDGLTGQARELHYTTLLNLQRAELSTGADRATRERRTGELNAQLRQLTALQARVESLRDMQVVGP